MCSSSCSKNGKQPSAPEPGNERFHAIPGLAQGSFAQTLGIRGGGPPPVSLERFGLTDQLRRASSSIGMTIAEGCGFDSDAEFARFPRIADGLLLSHDLGYLPADKHAEMERDVQEVKQMLYLLGRRLKGDG